MSTIFLVDGSSIFFRAYHGIRELRRSDGMATNALYGYISTLRSLIKDYKPDEMVVAFDLPEPTFRHKKYEAYKGNRKDPPDDLIVQISPIKTVTQLMGIPQVECAGYEADDLIGTLALLMEQQNKKVMLVSGDKDLMQLINPSIQMLRLNPVGKHKIYGESEVIERYGVPPAKIIEVFALMGDSSDNIPGVPGIGEKTAIALIQQYGTVEHLYEHLDEIKGKKRQENLRNNKEMAFLSRELVTLATDVPLESNGFSKKVTMDVDGLRAFYEDMEFRTFAAELPRSASSPAPDKNYQSVSSVLELQTIADQIQSQGCCAFDTETTSLNPLEAQCVGLSLSIEDHQGWYVPFRHSRGTNLSLAETKPILKDIFENASIHKTGHNVKYDCHILANEGISVQGITDDSLIASYLCQPHRSSRKLDDLAYDELGMAMTPISALIGEGPDQKNMAELGVDDVTDYACEDADAAWQLRSVMIKKIKECEQEFLYQKIEIPLVQVLVAMERKGIRVDAAILKQQSHELGQEMDQLTGSIFQSVGREFNLNSPSQLAQILYDDLKIVQGRKRSTRADILEKLAQEGVPIARQILDYRHRHKIKSTYLDALQKLIRPETGRVHTTYNQAVVNTGRISSKDPNLQNIPIRTDLGRRVRRAFVAADQCVLVSLDYSQIELRILAHISQDAGLLKAFAEQQDVHALTASEVFAVPLEDVTPDQRRKGKEINFGLNYGMSPYGLARRLGIDDEEAATYIQTYFSRYPLVQRYMDETVTFAQEHLYVKTAFGRRIPTPGVRDSNRQRQDNARRAAINAPIQGTAADLMKKAMVDVFDEINSSSGDAAILLTVHDELVLEVRQDIAEDVCERCRRRMETALEFSVPTPVEIAIGTSWADLK